MDKTQEPPKKCYCARCFLPVEAEDRVDIEGQSFHRLCSMCCVCRTIPPSLKMFYGHVFCNECFKMHVLSRFRGDNPRMHSNSWWMQWAPGTKPQEANCQNESKETRSEDQPAPEEPQKKCICARCLQSVDENEKVNISGQSFHPQCAKCYFCHTIPTDNIKIYYGQVFCEECFNKHVLNRNKDNPSEFFKNCFEQWQNNTQFAENMREFLAGNKESAPFIFMMQGQQPPFCRCGTGPQDWFQNNEPKKCLVHASTVHPLSEDERENSTMQTATPAVSIGEASFGTWDLSFENRTEVSDMPESCQAIDESANVENSNVSAAEKIEKLTKYLHERGLSGPEKLMKKWQNFNENDKFSNGSDYEEHSYCRWVDLQEPKRSAPLDCPKCLWQCGPIYVNSDYLQKEVCCGEIYE
ncbi:uncharacterized protein LOC124643792 [Helicoverpa zea]|uniref:uncharacterized protein LOC124643792 n=1 Tax=Helicoverpa zea TaxID=7113 RepID=UPI001F58420A|nr:uncharacterized protein LOC124643792 [Helicoverpa zea]